MSNQLGQYPMQPHETPPTSELPNQWVAMDLGDFATFLATELDEHQRAKGWGEAEIGDFNKADDLLIEHVALQYNAALGDQDAKNRLDNPGYVDELAAAKQKTEGVWDEVINRAMWSEFWQDQQRMQQELVDADSEWELSADGRKKKKKSKSPFALTTHADDKSGMPFAA